VEDAERVTDDVGVLRAERGLEIDGAFAARSEDPFRRRLPLLASEVSLSTERCALAPREDGLVDSDRRDVERRALRLPWTRDEPRSERAVLRRRDRHLDVLFGLRGCRTEERREDRETDDETFHCTMTLPTMPSAQ
jgi:hypothetical protein